MPRHFRETALHFVSRANSNALHILDHIVELVSAYSGSHTAGSRIGASGSQPLASQFGVAYGKRDDEAILYSAASSSPSPTKSPGGGMLCPSSLRISAPASTTLVPGP